MRDKIARLHDLDLPGLRECGNDGKSLTVAQRQSNPVRGSRRSLATDMTLSGGVLSSMHPLRNDARSSRRRSSPDRFNGERRSIALRQAQSVSLQVNYRSATSLVLCLALLPEILLLSRDCRTTEIRQRDSHVADASNVGRIRLCAKSVVAKVAQSPGKCAGIRTTSATKT